MPRSASRSAASKTRRPVGAWVRGLLVAIATLCLVAGFTLWVVTRSWFIIGRVTPVLERRLGGDVTIGHAAYEGNGRFLFRNVSLHVPGVAGPGGEVCHIQRARVVTDMTALLSGDVRFEDVQLSEPVIRISEDAHEAGVFSFMSLTPDWTSDSADQLHPPRVRIEKAIVEVGEHDGSNYTMHGRRALSGSMLPLGAGEGWYSVALVEVDQRGQAMEESAGGILVKGRWNAETNAHAFHINGLSLDDRAYGMGSQIARLWWDRLNLTGRVSEVDVRWSPEEDFQVDFVIQDVGLTLPIETADLWARYEDGRIEPSSNRPRMHVRSGRISLARDTITLDDLQGELLSAANPEPGGEDASPDATAAEVIGVPYRVSVTIGDLPKLDWADRQQWMDEALAVAPFRMEFRTDDFRVQPRGGNAARAVELPLAVARVLERFRLTDWVLSTSIEVTREPPQRGEDGELQAQEICSTGKAFITDASGTYEKFPYALSNVEAHLEFDNHQIVVHYLTGSGSHDATVRLTGTITPPSKYPAVSLRLTAHDVPVDERLRGALREPEQEIFDALMHQASFEALAKAGLLVDEEAVEAARQARPAAAAERAELLKLGAEATPAQQKRLAELDAFIDRQQRLIDAGPFRLGGTVDLDLRIDRAEGKNQRTFTTGLVMIQSLGLLYERFPYPLQILGGTLDWQRDAVTIQSEKQIPELPIVTPGGGRGSLRGRLNLPVVGGKTRIVPDLIIDIRDDEINDALYAAIPPVQAERNEHGTAEGWPGMTMSRGAQWLKDLGLEGSLAYTARITTDADDELDYNINLRLLDGRAEPTTAITRALGAGLLEPDLWHLDDCRASLEVTREAIELKQFTARHLNGHVEVDGRIDLTRDPFELAMNLHLQETALGEYLINLLPAGQIEDARALWERYRPEGTFDADLLYRQRGEEAEPIVLYVRPDEVALHIDDEPLTLTPIAGCLRIEGRQVHFDDLEMAVRREEEDEGRLRLAGSYGLPAQERPEHVRVEGSWKSGQLQSPLIGEALRRFGAPDLAERYEGFEPAGEFDAVFSYEAAQAGQPRLYDLSIFPSTVSFKLHETPMFFELEEGSEIRFTPGLVELGHLRGENVGGRFVLTGQICTTPLIEAALNFDFEGQLTSNQVAALLPETVKNFWEAIRFKEGQPSHLEDGVLRLTQMAAGDDGEPDWAADFAGRLTVNDASFRAGLNFDDVTGPLQLRAGRRPPQPPYLQIDTELEQVRTLGQHLTDARAAITLTDDGRAVVLREARADAQGGVATARATVGIGDRRDYAVSARLVGVPLGDFVVRPPSPDSPPPEEKEEDADRVPGLVYASLDLSGQRDDIGSRIGRGVVRVLGGKLATIPLSLQLLHLVQFTSPSEGPDYANAEFYVTGDRVTFERILFESTRGKAAWLQLMGVGRLDLNTFELDARFHSRSAVLVLRDLVGEIGDQFVAIEVTGPLWDPKADIITLPNLNKPRSAIVGASPLLREGGD
jgi:hypothetical protein